MALPLPLPTLVSPDMEVREFKRGRNHMGTIATVAITCWLCTFISIPRKPRFGNEVAELVYAHLLGRQLRLALLAGVLSAVLLLAVILSLPQHVATDGHAAPTTGQTASGCNDEMLCPWMYGQH
jgi:hypothetical protein